jgi:hypothetical protein
MPDQASPPFTPLTLDDVRALHLPQGRYYGPCAGGDVPLALELFGAQCSDFLFCDMKYPGHMPGFAELLPEGWCLLERSPFHPLPGEARSTWYSARPFLPASQSLRLERPDGTAVTAEFRKDLAQEVLLSDFGPRSIACFMHINDSAGEGGSNLWFLGSEEGAPQHDSDNPAVHLLEPLAERLMDGAVVVTQSLCDRAFRDGAPFERAGMAWEPLGELTAAEGRVWGRTFVWRARVVG